MIWNILLRRNKETKTSLHSSLQLIVKAHILTRLVFPGFLSGQEHYSIYRKVLLTQYGDLGDLPVLLLFFIHLKEGHL